jgi:aldehyde dehydrogenase (NAD+)
MLTFFFLLGYRKIAPTLLLDVPQDSAIMTGEIFGPLLPIVTVSDISLPS